MKKIIELTTDIKKHFDFLPLGYMFDCFANQIDKIDLFADDDSAVLLHQYQLFVGGKCTVPALEAIRSILTEDKRARLGCLKVFYPIDTPWHDELFKLAPHCWDNSRSLYKFTSCKRSQVVVPPEVRRIDRQLFATVGNGEMIADEVLGTDTYRSMEDFFDRGVGYTTVKDNTVVGFCTSEYPSDKALAIGIEVEEQYQRQCYAKAMTTAFVSEVRRKYPDCDIYWECWQRNTPSVNTALSCGFTLVSHYPMLFFKF